jgi:phosphoribosylformylglycinamidine cyclo-ligase
MDRSTKDGENPIPIFLWSIGNSEKIREGTLLALPGYRGHNRVAGGNRMTQDDKLTYEQSGVDYSRIDPLKVMAQKAALGTAGNLRGTGFDEIAASRGESAYVIDMGDWYMASIVECLGTKSLVADQVRIITGRTHYDQIAQDTIAMAVNDIVTVGARALSIHAYWATGGSEWFSDEERMRDLVDGWARTCDLVGAAWGGGETPCLSGIVAPGSIDLAASCVGIIRPKERLIVGKSLQAGDAIVLLPSSGIHANGITLARKLAEILPDGYGTRLPDGRRYGEALLDPTLLYSAVVEALLSHDVPLHYISNITGHGWRKLMRHPGAFTYRITTIPPVPPVLQFIVDSSHMDLSQAYGSLNMGAGFALFMPGAAVSESVRIAEQLGIRAIPAGHVEAGAKQVRIDPLGILYEGESLNLRL